MFCSGIEQIDRFFKHFTEKMNLKLFKILKLHIGLTPEEQKEVFADTDKFKLIFATKIAETSITINGIKVVIDLGKDIDRQYNQ